MNLQKGMVRISVDVINKAYQFINPCKQRELSLRNLQIPTIENLGVTKDQFDVIDLTDNNIRKLENFPKLKRLETLLMHNNRVEFVAKDIAEQLPNLSTLVLTNNNLVELGDIDNLAGLTRLNYISLQGNPLTHKPKYRPYLIYKLKHVRVIDYKRVTLAERQAAKKMFKGEAGKLLKRELVRHSQISTTAQPEEEIERAKKRPSEEQKKIRELIAGAKTLADVERVNQILQGTTVEPTNGHENGNDVEMQEESED